MNTSRKIWLVAFLLLLAPASSWAQAPGAAAWSGFYVGAHAGMAWHDLFYVEPDDPDAALSPSISGFAGGVLAGYARPIGQLTAGLEFDTGTATASFSATAAGGNDYTALETGWNSHLRGRVAYPRGRVAPFFTAGLAALRIKVDDVDEGFGESSSTHLGWTVGGGVDAAFTARLAVRVELLHDDYNMKTQAISAPQGPFFPGYDVDVDGKANVLRAAVLYRF